jgi:acyl-CoA thioesterase
VGDLAADTALEPADGAPAGGGNDEGGNDEGGNDEGGAGDDDSGGRGDGRDGGGAAHVRRYTGELRPDWAIWGPNGGYVAALALRAAGLATGRARPASIVAHLLGVAAFDDVDVEVTVLRRARFATSARVCLTQGARPILEALVWGIDPGGVALVHDAAPAPDVAPPDQVPSREDRLAALPPDQPGPPSVPFFDNLDQRPLDWQDDWPPPGPLEPRARWWTRFRPTARFGDLWVDACRLLIPIDTMGWPAASMAHAHIDPPQAVAVTVDLSVRFLRPTGDEWLLVEATSPAAAGGLVTATGRVWDASGALVASGGQTMLCRPTGA